MKRVCLFLAISASSLAGAMIFPALWAAFEDDGGLRPLALSLLCGAAVALMFAAAGRRARFSEMTAREVLLAVVASWFSASLIASLPYIFSGTLADPLDAIFEGVSGVTTTGASVIDDLESVPRSIRLWRCLSQWLGGIGIVVLALALFPVSGAGMQLFKAEVTGPVRDRFTPRIRNTAAFLCKTYLILTAAQTLVLMIVGGLTFYDALTLSMSTVATGGFSPYHDSVGHFNSSTVLAITGVFLFLSASNLALFHTAFVRRSLFPAAKDPEMRFFMVLLVIFGGFMAEALYLSGSCSTIGESLKEGYFHTMSMLSTCGFFSADYNVWPASARFMLLMLMFVGGCAISTSGGITCARAVVILKHTREEFARLLHPKAVIPVRSAGQVISTEVVLSCFAFVIAYLGLLLIGFAMLTMFGADLTTALSSAAAALSNVGPSFGMAGPTSSYASQPASAKVIYMVLMLAGRLEIFTFFAIFSRSFIRR